MTSDFFNLLYHGYTGEYQLMSALYRHGLDALRPPADMGIDVVSLNLKERLENPEVAPETFYFQVKTAVTDVREAEDAPGAITTVYFKLTDAELDLLCKGRDRALVCYVYNSEIGALTDAYEAPFMCFWIDGTRLAAIRNAGALFRMQGETKQTLAFQLRKPTHEYGHWYAVAVGASGNQAPEGYLGTVDTGSASASDGAYHYSIKGYLDFARA